MFDSPMPKPTVILVDDDAALRTALKFSLELEGFEVVACDSAETLLARELPAADACLVLDYNLPGMSGLDALVRLRDRDVRLPALIITSHPRAKVRDGIRAARARLVEKPLLGDTLVGSIQDALRA
jgi:FixJ family two-component response regulator